MSMRRWHLAIIRGAALWVPSRQRAEWLAEWRSELWYAAQSGSKARTIWFCLGAFPDALWLRRNCASPQGREMFRFKSPLQCGLFLAVLAAVSLFFAFRLPGPRDVILPSPYRDAANLVMMSGGKNFDARLPTIPIEQYRSLVNRARGQFTGFAFYQPLLTNVPTAGRRTAELSIAMASNNLFELLGIPVPSPGRDAALILNRTAWRKYFGGDPHIAGQVLEVAGQQARLAGVISADAWRLPGRIDAWLLQDDQRLAALPPHSKGFVLAHVRTQVHTRRDWCWHLSVANEHGGYDDFECASLVHGQPIFAYLLIIVLAVSILPATTSLPLGEYPADGHRPPRATRARRWIFLGIKLALILPIVFCGTLDLAPIISSSGIQPHAMLAGYVLAFRWALIDQRRRCPVCLRLLTNPTRIGQRSQTFLEWYGTELICDKGHGLLHVTEIPTSCYSAQRWLYLDSSWSGLFS